MKNSTEYINYQDPLTVAKALEKAAQIREAKQLEEQKRIESMATHEEFAKDDDTIIHEAKKEEGKYFFKNILIFTNDRDSSTNKTLKNLEQAVKGKGVEIFPFVAEEVDYKATDDKIEWHDNKNKYKVDEQSNIDTIVITRLGAQDSEECMELIKELQDWGFFVLNPIQFAKKASNKYQSAVLMERYEIPQPRFTLISKNDILKGEESLKKKLKVIYPDLGKDEEEDKKKEYVVKILDGHGGTGVTMQSGKTILSMLQMVFAVDEKRELLVQKKEEADGGDIRVHVLTMRTHQKILAQMKRKKIGGDFRSNVSLGATAEKVELTPEQEEIALKVAKISGMPWCAVDIMPLVKGSNNEIGDNVVLEYNASPGTDGISEVIDDNFMEILLNEINDVNELVLAPKAIGYLETVKFTMDNDDEFEFEAKFDTGNGAKASTIGCDSLEYKGNLVIATIEGKKYQFTKAGESRAIVGQVTEPRVTVIIPCIQVGSRKLLDVEFALVDNRNKKQKVLINRDVMSRLAYQINPAKKHILEDDLAYSFKEEADKKAAEEEAKKNKEKK